MIAYVGRGYYKEHIIPVFRRVAPFPRNFPFRIHSHVPTRAVQFTILSIIDSGYKIADAFIYTALLLHKFFGTSAIIDKTLFYVIPTLVKIRISYFEYHLKGRKSTERSNKKGSSRRLEESTLTKGTPSE